MFSAPNSSWTMVVSIGATVAILVVDWLTPAGIVVGILLAIPILLASTSDETQDIVLVASLAMAGFAVAAIFGRGPTTPAQVWVPNRIFAALTLPASALLAFVLHRRRLMANAAREEAVRASDLNRLLISLLAHDLRAPLGMAIQTLDYVAPQKRARGSTAPHDARLVADVRLRLQRSLSTMDTILQVATANQHTGTTLTGTEVAAVLQSEVLAFEHEGMIRDKRLAVVATGSPKERYSLDPLIARQCVAILVDNTIRHAVPGSIDVQIRVDTGLVRFSIADEGPGLHRDPNEATKERGAGLGLELCRALILRAGGSLTVVRDAPDGTAFELRLPLEFVPHS